ncbi:MAG: DUF5985 family protein [Betaproteobacteria bacterium]
MATFNLILYLLAVLTCLACTVMLARGYMRTRERLLLWSTLCFVGLSISNILLFFDLIVFVAVPEVDLRPWRLASSLGGLAFLLHGFIWEAEDN